MEKLDDRKRNLPLPPMTALPVFEAVGRHLSVARAAETLNLTPGAVSRQIQNLELYLGIPLFVRSHRRMIFTPEGEEYWTNVSAALADLRDATRVVASRAEDAPLTIVVPRMFLQRILLPRLSTFYAQHPGTRIKFLTTGIGASPADGTIAISPELRDDHIYDVLAEANLTPVCSPRYLSSAAPLAKRSDLAEHTLLRSRDYLQNWTKWLSVDADHVLNRAQCIDFESPGLELTAAIEGLGVTIVRVALVQDEMRTGQLVALFPEHIVREQYVFAFSASRKRTNSFSSFRNWVKHSVL